MYHLAQVVTLLMIHSSCPSRIYYSKIRADKEKVVLPLGLLGLVGDPSDLIL